MMDNLNFHLLTKKNKILLHKFRSEIIYISKYILKFEALSGIKQKAKID